MKCLSSVTMPAHIIATTRITNRSRLVPRAKHLYAPWSATQDWEKDKAAVPKHAVGVDNSGGAMIKLVSFYNFGVEIGLCVK